MTVLIQDSTLREGQQTPFVNLTVKQKVSLASMLSDFGVHFMDVFTAASEGEREVTRQLNDMGLKTEIVSLSRALERDIDAALECNSKWVGIFQPTSPIQLDAKMRINEEQCLKNIESAIDYGVSHGAKVRFGLEDASRTSYDFVKATCKLAESCKAKRVTLADTVGAMRPDQMKELVSKIHSEVSIPVDVHCHNDMGLALANALAAYEAGASCIHATINGAGERAGIVRLAELVVALEVLYDEKLDVKKEMLTQLSETFSEYAGIPMNPLMPVVGKNAFKHKSGIHVSALLRNKESYEIIDPTSVGNRRSFVLGEYSGKAMMKHLSDKLGLGLNDEQIAREMLKIKRKSGDILEFCD